MYLDFGFGFVKQGLDNCRRRWDVPYPFAVSLVSKYCTYAGPLSLDLQEFAVDNSTGDRCILHCTGFTITMTGMRTGVMYIRGYIYVFSASCHYHVLQNGYMGVISSSDCRSVSFYRFYSNVLDLLGNGGPGDRNCHGSVVLSKAINTTQNTISP